MNLLQIGAGAIEIIVVSIFSITIWLLLLRWALGIDVIIQHVKAQSNVLIKIAKYNNVPPDEINEALGKGTRIGAHPGFEDVLANIIVDAGIAPAIDYAVNMKGFQYDAAKSYVDRLVAKKNLLPKSRG